MWAQILRKKKTLKSGPYYCDQVYKIEMHLTFWRSKHNDMGSILCDGKNSENQAQIIVIRSSTSKCKIIRKAKHQRGPILREKKNG